MPPRTSDVVGAAVLTLVLFALIAIILIANVPAAEA
jgi:hypothetical protein